MHVSVGNGVLLIWISDPDPKRSISVSCLLRGRFFYLHTLCCCSQCGGTQRHAAVLGVGTRLQEKKIHLQKAEQHWKSWFPRETLARELGLP